MNTFNSWLAGALGVLSAFNRQSKQLLQLSFDSAAGCVAAVLALYVNGLDVQLGTVQALLWVFGTGLMASALFASGGVYKNVVRFIAVSVAIRLGFMSCLIGLGSAFLLGLLNNVYSWRIGFDVSLLLAAFVLFPRGLLRWLVERNSMVNKPAALIYGAGAAGRQLLAALRNSHDFRVLGFVDDDQDLAGASIMGLPVWVAGRVGPVAERCGVQTILLAIPSAGLERRKKVVEALEKLNVKVLTVPGVKDLISGKANLAELKEIAIEDLLGRPSVKPVPVLISADITGKTVAVTGAGGSIGSELCRQAVLQRAQKLVLIEVTEFALYSIDQELRALCSRKGVATEIVPVLASVTDANRVAAVFRTHSVNTVYHAAAYKQVPLVEANASRAIVNNALATYRTAKEALAAEVESFVLISTDKAVRPTNVMGASKRMAELAVQALAESYAKKGQHISIVRFGNVLGSSGSVVPLFRRQIASGGPVTVTHPEIIRYFMTIPEAAQLVIQAGAMARRGDVFVLDMGEPVRIVDLASRMIRLSGLSVKNVDAPDGDIALEYSGLRPGEKLYEELLVSGKEFETEHERIRRIVEPCLPLGEVESLLDRLEKAVDGGDLETVKQVMQTMPLHWSPSTESLQDSALAT